MNEAAYAATAKRDADARALVGAPARDNGADFFERQGLEAIVAVGPGAAGGVAQYHRRQRDGGGNPQRGTQAQSIPTLASIRKKRSVRRWVSLRLVLRSLSISSKSILAACTARQVM